MKYGNTYIHSVMVLYNSYNDTRFSDLSEEHKNQLLWASLMHDLGKRGKPIFEGKDHIHPFRSAAFVLKIFAENNIIEKHAHDEALVLAEILLNSHKTITDKKFLKRHRKHLDSMCLDMHDHKNLPEIFEKLKRISGDNNEIKNIFILVLFHQSIYGIK